MTEEQIILAARSICADQADKHDSNDRNKYLSGDWDHTAWMRLIIKGIKYGMESERIEIEDWLKSYGKRQTADGVKRADYIRS